MLVKSAIGPFALCGLQEQSQGDDAVEWEAHRSALPSFSLTRASSVAALGQ
jgi:hypothetical protein